jgi:hypothetical protein
MKMPDYEMNPLFLELKEKLFLFTKRDFEAIKNLDPLEEIEIIKRVLRIQENWIKALQKEIEKKEKLEMTIQEKRVSMFYEDLSLEQAEELETLGRRKLGIIWKPVINVLPSSAPCERPASDSSPQPKSTEILAATRWAKDVLKRLAQVEDRIKRLEEDHKDLPSLPVGLVAEERCSLLLADGRCKGFADLNQRFPEPPLTGEKCIRRSRTQSSRCPWGEQAEKLAQHTSPSSAPSSGSSPLKGLRTSDSDLY